MTFQSVAYSLTPCRVGLPRSHTRSPLYVSCTHPSSTGLPLESTPLVDAVVQRGRKLDDVPFHVPGHKRGTSTPPALEEILTDPLRFDLTELSGLDYLSYPDGPILQAQQLAAQSFGAVKTWFLVNGTTVGIHAAVMATCAGPKDALLLARNAHLSAFNAAVLSGCTPIYIQPAYAYGMAHHITPEALEEGFLKAEEAGLQAKAVLIVSPTYFGIMSDMKALADVCHARGAALIVDEAHGAHCHLLLKEDVPLTSSTTSSRVGNGSGNEICSIHSTLAAGADIVIQSTHKQLSAMTQAAMLHLGTGNSNSGNDTQSEGVSEPRKTDGTFGVSAAKISRALQILQTSSPSYLLMCSLDAARAHTHIPGVLNEPIKAAALLENYFTQQHHNNNNSTMNEDAALQPRLLTPACCIQNRATGESFDNSLSSSFSTVIRDPWRFTILVDHLGLSGWEAAEILEREYNIVPELANHAAVVFALSMGSTTQHVHQLIHALDSLSQSCKITSPNNNTLPTLSSCGSKVDGSLPQMKFTPRDAFFAESESVPLDQAVGKVAAELVCPYPPGVPALYPGEVIEGALLQELERVLKSGGKVVGCADGQLKTIRVVVE